MNSNISEELKDENSSKLLGKKRKYFTIEKDFKNNRKLSSEKYSEDNLSEGRWSYNEQVKFIEGLSKEGNNWKKIREIINTRTLPQIRSHAQKFFKRLKRCKNDKLGIDFTSNSIRSIKDMINHIKIVNKDYDISKIFLYLCFNEPKNNDGLKENNLINKNVNNDNINILNSSPQINNNKDNNINFNLNNLNNILLIQSLNNMNNALNAFILNYLNKSIVIDNLINKFYNSIKDMQSKANEYFNKPKASNNFIIEIENNKKIL